MNNRTPWKKLNIYNRRALFLIGYTEEIWDTNNFSKLQYFTWDEIFESNEIYCESKVAILILGWDKNTWDSLAMILKLIQNNQRLFNNSDYFVMPDKSIFDKEWQELGTVEINCLKYLDITIELKDLKNPFNLILQFEVLEYIPFLFTFNWYNLNCLQQTAAKILGFYPELWNANSEIIPNYLTIWNTIPNEIRSNYKILGFSEENWNDAKFIPESFNKKWNQLSELEKIAAEYLGFNEEYWNTYIYQFK